jgi:hypothetical protein
VSICNPNDDGGRESVTFEGFGFHIQVYEDLTVLLRLHGVRDLIKVCLPTNVPVAFERAHKIHIDRDSDAGASSSDVTEIVFRMIIVLDLVSSPFYNKEKSQQGEFCM